MKKFRFRFIIGTKFKEATYIAEDVHLALNMLYGDFPNAKQTTILSKRNSS